MLTASARADWYPADLPFEDYLSHPITGVAAPGPSDVWAVTTYAYFYQDRDHVRWNSNAYHSRNDGLLWDLPFDAPTSQTDPTPNKYPFQDTQLYAVSFADRDNGWLFGWQKPTFGKADPPGPYVFYHTVDRGRTWTISTLPNPAPTTPDEPDFAIDALAATHAIAVQGAHVFETTDGATWTERAGPYPRLFSLQASGLATPRAAGSNAGRGVGGSLGPLGFVQDVSVAGAFHATRFADAGHGWVAGGDGKNGLILGTSSGGAAWTSQLTAPDKLFRGLAAPSASEAWAVGQSTGATPAGAIYHTVDAGKTWIFDAATPGRMFCVAFRDSLHGWAAGDGGLYRYVPLIPVAAGDLDRSGQADRLDVALALRRVAGIEAAGPGDNAAAGSKALSVADAVRALRGTAFGSASPAQDDPSRVVIVYNTLAPDADGNGVGDSLQVAQYYAAKRAVPAANIVPISWHDTDGFQDHGTADNDGRANWTDAYHAVVEPIEKAIDSLGRANVDTILFCAYVPYRFNVTAPDGTWDTIALDTAVNDLYRTDPDNWASGSPYYAPLAGAGDRYGRPRFETGGRPMGQPVAAATGSGVRDPYYLVSRIDGPTLDSCLAMIDNALFAETYRGPAGYQGGAYIDTRALSFQGAPYSLDELRAWVPSFYDYSQIDESIARSLLTFADRGLPWRDEVTNAPIGAPSDGTGPRWRDGSPAVSAPGAMFYAGWYNYGTYYPVWDWLPGSVGIDYDSASAYDFRGTGYFGGGALADGLTALVGVIGEPYSYHPKPDALMEYLARGYSFAEAAMLSTETPRMAKALFIGDPLYRPFKPHPPTPVPVPALSVASARTATGWTVSLTSDVPVKAMLQYTANGTIPVASSPSVAGSPVFYALRHSFAVRANGPIRFVIHATDPTGRVTDTAVQG